ncbi:transposase, IS605 OrfB family protein [Natrialba chahannaoensis JCM 10990]|uniref:Transposase, IS605 OrfB family protein n=1 Tax=Natrialba chahannaoensis JCM 10990 TaxID=1227492 RepID=M0ARZ0_9EURY|nr:transposase, IS605 OrfB family protein [Natrialba chahannaoensis JCM 10990]
MIVPSVPTAIQRPAPIETASRPPLSAESSASDALSSADQANADVNGAENIRQKVSPSHATDGVDETQSVSSAHQNAKRSEDGDRSNGWLAQPSTFLFDKETGAFAPQERVTS